MKSIAVLFAFLLSTPAMACYYQTCFDEMDKISQWQIQIKNGEMSDARKKRAVRIIKHQVEKLCRFYQGQHNQLQSQIEAHERGYIEADEIGTGHDQVYSFQDKEGIKFTPTTSQVRMKALSVVDAKKPLEEYLKLLAKLSTEKPNCKIHELPKPQRHAQAIGEIDAMYKSVYVDPLDASGVPVVSGSTRGLRTAVGFQPGAL